MNKERLLKVAKALRESPNPRLFTMAYYGHGCGTPACAFGHYAARRDMQREFKLVTDDFSAKAYVTNRSGDVSTGTDDAVCKHFDIDYQQADALFAHDGCDGAETAKQAAKFIERFVARGGM